VIDQRLQTGGRVMQCDDAAKQADDRDASIINGIFTAGLILQSGAVHIASGDVIGHVERAIEELDNAIRDIRSAAFARRIDARVRGGGARSSVDQRESVVGRCCAAGGQGGRPTTGDQPSHPE
jgi:hypothetical protein